MVTRLRIAFTALALIGPFACSHAASRAGFQTTSDDVATPEEEQEAPPAGDFGGDFDAGMFDSGDAAFQTCAATAVEATRERLPVDIIWIVDNSSSMQPAVAEVQAGLNAFATLIGSKGIDYQVVMLSKRGTTPANKTYPICIPPPLGGANCANGPSFFHASMDVLSTQPLEQFLGTLDQTAGYTPTEKRGSEPWAQVLRANATKTIVVVTDDDSRLNATLFETFDGGANPDPLSSTTLPPGVLHPSRGDQFKGYLFNGIYGWGSPTDPTVRCTYPNNTQPAKSGAVYTQLVKKTGGVRAKLCDGASAWGPFFDDIAKAVETTSRIACELAMPKADGGLLDPEAVNVRVTDGTNPAVVVPRVANEAACGNGAGWYYDNPKAPTKVILCPTSCEGAQSKGGDAPPKIDVLFGCQSVVR